MYDLFDDTRHYELQSGRASRIDVVFGWALAGLLLLSLIGLAAL